MSKCKLTELSFLIEDLDDEFEIETKLLLRGEMGLAVSGLRFFFILSLALKRVFHQILQH